MKNSKETFNQIIEDSAASNIMHIGRAAAAGIDFAIDELKEMGLLMLSSDTDTLTVLKQELMNRLKKSMKVQQ